ncbi:MAG: FKBP-type peptidyl-prolyl cis-trans isomerase [Schleiferiaceae bacterium]|nr:FKBP-type peptidyl-prolyl cis-trans isomerase [Schleiferiaceae bacterium]
MKLKQSIHIFSLALIAILFLSGCSKSDESAQLDADIRLIEDYIASNNLNAVPTGSGLYIVTDYLGNGKSPNSNSTITIRYKGYRLDGFVFEDTGNSPATFNLGSLMQGWREGLPYFKEGGRGTLLIPSGLAYGSNSPSPDIPANSVLLFDIELIAVY